MCVLNCRLLKNAQKPHFDLNCPYVSKTVVMTGVMVYVTGVDESVIKPNYLNDHYHVIIISLIKTNDKCFPL